MTDNALILLGILFISIPEICHVIFNRQNLRLDSTYRLIGLACIAWVALT